MYVPGDMEIDIVILGDWMARCMRLGDKRDWYSGDRRDRCSDLYWDLAERALRIYIRIFESIFCGRYSPACLWIQLCASNARLLLWLVCPNRFWRRADLTRTSWTCCAVFRGRDLLLLSRWNLDFAKTGNSWQVPNGLDYVSVIVRCNDRMRRLAQLSYPDESGLITSWNIREISLLIVLELLEGEAQII